MRARRPAAGCHAFSDITISGIRTSGLDAALRARRGRLPLVVAGGQVRQRGVAPARIVPTLDEVKDRPAGLGLGGEPLAIEQLALEGREEALAQRVVVGVAHRANRGADARRSTPAADGDRRVLAA